MRRIELSDELEECPPVPLGAASGQGETLAPRRFEFCEEQEDCRAVDKQSRISSSLQVPEGLPTKLRPKTVECAKCDDVQWFVFELLREGPEPLIRAVLPGEQSDMSSEPLEL